MTNSILLSTKSWHACLLESLSRESDLNWIWIKEKRAFTYEKIRKINPIKIFIPHWSSMIPEEIYSNFECVVFHMTDLPYGRGGSPLQNLIVRGHKVTRISAIKVSHGIDTGDIYLKSELSLEGTAQEIFERSNPIIKKMIDAIIGQNIKPQPQVGEPVKFERRKPSEGNLGRIKDLKQVYDFIRMLDADGYPKAFLETEFFRFEFQNVTEAEGKGLKANVRIIKR